MWFDSHCHLHLCAENEPVGDLVDRARSGGVDGTVTIGIDVESSRISRDIAHDHGVWFAAGLHPNSADEWDGETEEALRSIAADERCVAIGETGLDFYRNGAPRDRQERVFRAQVDLAKETDKALVIHTRDSLVAALEVLEECGAPDRFVFHCWSGTEVERALDLGAFISFAGNVSFPSADDLRSAARVVPADRLLVETDAPFLSPVPKRGRPNEPARVALVGAAVATAREEPEESVAERTTANALRLFGLTS